MGDISSFVVLLLSAFTQEGMWKIWLVEGEL